MLNSTAFKVVGLCCVLTCLTVLWSIGWESRRSMSAVARRHKDGISNTYKNTRHRLRHRKLFRTVQLSRGPLNSTDRSVHSEKSIKLTLSGSSADNHSRHEGLPYKSKQCGQPKHNIVFFKMHKCSSSTVQNVLMRYGDVHDLNFVLPPSGNYLGHTPFTRRAMYNFGAKEYNILCHHTRFSHEGMAEVMPKNSVWTTILRDPVDMFESTFYYRHLHHIYGIVNEPDPLAVFSLDPDYYVRRYGYAGIGRSPMLFDLGLRNYQKGDIAATKDFISALDEYFDLVLLTEYFEESMILFKELMCWDLDDIVYFVVNARAKDSVHAVRPAVRERLKRWNFGDVMLYEHFNRTFWKKVEAFGVERMRREVALLKERNRELQERCILDPELTVNQGGVYHPGVVNVKGLVVRRGMEGDKLCKNMARPELAYTSYLLAKQKKRYNKFFDFGYNLRSNFFKGFNWW